MTHKTSDEAALIRKDRNMFHILIPVNVLEGVLGMSKKCINNVMA